jgi:signal transduction histidine kinase
MTVPPAVAVAPRRPAFWDPVLLLPAVVAAGIAIGWLGIDEGVSGARIAVDLALAWALVAAGLVVLERPRWKRASALLVGAAFAVLAGDLVWASSRVAWTVGFLVAGLWAAMLVQLVLTSPAGRSPSRIASLAVVAAYLLALAGQLARLLVLDDSRDALSLSPDPGVAHTIARAEAACGLALGLLVVALLGNDARRLRGAALRARGPLTAAALATLTAGLVRLTWVLVSDTSASTAQTVARGVAVSTPLAVIAGILWSRLRHPAASDLVVELRTGAAIGMRERLARALGDPTLEIAYRLGEGRYVDATGRRVELPRRPDRTLTPVTAGGDEIAVLVHDPALLDEPALVESVRATAGLVLENERLAAEVRSQLAEVRASRGRIVAAADAERRRIERDLHDGAQQRLVTLSVALGLEASRADPEAASALERAQSEVEAAIAELRELARGIHPTLLRDEGLEAAVEALARRAALPVTVRGSLPSRLPEMIELAAYFVVAESLTNVVKHADAEEASIVLEHDGARLRVAVTDDGRGGARVVAGSGLAELRDRLEALDATLAVESVEGAGTTVRAEFPCAS